MIIINKKAEKYIKSSDSATKKRLKEAIKKLPAFGDIKKLAGYDNFYRLRVGDLRILFTCENEDIIILDIKPRGQAYKRIWEVLKWAKSQLKI
mgnify:CR=1 FL=1